MEGSAPETPLPIEEQKRLERERAEQLLPMLESMTPLAVAGYLHYVDALNRALRRRQMDPAVDFTDGDERLQEQVKSEDELPIYHAMELLPEHNPEHAHAIMAILTDSPFVEDRANAGIFLPSFTPHDPERGFQLWQRLMGDPAPSVCFEAENSLPEIDDDPEEYERELEKVGLTRDQASQLRWIAHDREAAEQANQ